LVISLNHQLANPGEYDDVSKENSFRSWCRHHEEHWYEGFYGPLTRLASAGLDVEVDAENLAEYASEHVVFTELCPYAYYREFVQLETGVRFRRNTQTADGMARGSNQSLCVPVRVSRRRERWRYISVQGGVPFDRLRLSSLLNDVDTDLFDSLKQWCDDFASKLPQSD
jgi:hypothetical protein